VKDAETKKRSDSGFIAFKDVEKASAVLASTKGSGLKLRYARPRTVQQQSAWAEKESQVSVDGGSQATDPIAPQ
jgi:hypothetical protein